jgi:hypothetical protein
MARGLSQRRLPSTSINPVPVSAWTQAVRSGRPDRRPTEAGVLAGQPPRLLMKATCRRVLAPSSPVLSYDDRSRLKLSSGFAFHSLHATSHAL